LEKIIGLSQISFRSVKAIDSPSHLLGKSTVDRLARMTCP
jgi:hypothetical protein